MAIIAADPARGSMTSLWIDSYDGGYHDLVDFSAISAIKDCVSVKTFGIQVGL